MSPLAKQDVQRSIDRARGWLDKAEAELQADKPNEPLIRGMLHCAESEAFTARDTMLKYQTPTSSPLGRNVDITIGDENA